MRRNSTIFLVAAIILNISSVNLYAEQVSEQKPFIVEDNYFSLDIYRIVQSKNGYNKITINGSEPHKQTIQSAKKAIKLPIAFNHNQNCNDFIMPSEINGIEMDIPYNYFSVIDSSAKYFQMLLYNDWELEYYNATSLCVQIGLVNELGIKCRLLIYEDYLKAYCSLM